MRLHFIFSIQYISHRQIQMKHYLLVDERPSSQEQTQDKEDGTIDKLEKVAASSISTVKNTFKKLSKTIYSFAKANPKTKTNGSDKKPSRATMDMIKHIHAGFDPICQSAKRWASQEQASKKQQGERLEQLIEKYESQRKQSMQKLVKRKIYKLDDDLPEAKFVYDLEYENVENYQSKLSVLKNKQDNSSQKTQEQKKSSEQNFDQKKEGNNSFAMKMTTSIVYKLEFGDKNSEQNESKSKINDKTQQIANERKEQQSNGLINVDKQSQITLKKGQSKAIENNQNQLPKSQQKKKEAPASFSLPVLTEQEKKKNPFFGQFKAKTMKDIISKSPSNMPPLSGLFQDRSQQDNTNFNQVISQSQSQININQYQNQQSQQSQQPPQHQSIQHSQPSQMNYSSNSASGQWPSQSFAPIFPTNRSTNPAYTNYTQILQNQQNQQASIGMSRYFQQTQQSQSQQPQQRVSFASALQPQRVFDQTAISSMFEKPKQQSVTSSLFGASNTGTPRTQKMQRKPAHFDRQRNKKKGNQMRVSE